MVFSSVSLAWSKYFLISVAWIKNMCITVCLLGVFQQHMGDIRFTRSMKVIHPSITRAASPQEGRGHAGADPR